MFTDSYLSKKKDKGLCYAIKQWLKQTAYLQNFWNDFLYQVGPLSLKMESQNLVIVFNLLVLSICLILILFLLQKKSFLTWAFIFVNKKEFWI